MLTANLDKHAAAPNDKERTKLPKLFYPSFCESHDDESHSFDNGVV